MIAGAQIAGFPIAGPYEVYALDLSDYIPPPDAGYILAPAAGHRVARVAGGYGITLQERYKLVPDPAGGKVIE